MLLPVDEHAAHSERWLLDLHVSMAMVFGHHYHHVTRTPKTAGLRAAEPAHGFVVQALVHASHGHWPGAVDHQPIGLVRSGVLAIVGQMRHGWSQCTHGL